jgi:hypothetical protein
VPHPTLIFGAFLSLLSAGIYFYVGRSLGRRRVASPESRLAWNLFVVWWYALAGSTFAGGLLSLLGALGMTSLALFVAVTQVNLLAICVGLFGMLYYLLYLFTGSTRWSTPLILFYLAYYTLMVYYISASVPVSVSLGRWDTNLEFQQPLTGPLIGVVLVLLVFPQIIGSLAYFTLFFRVKEATQKYRVAMVSMSILVWFLSAFLARIAGLSQFDWWQVASRLIGLAATLAILLAYKPMPWIKRRLGVISISDEVA